MGKRKIKESLKKQKALRILKYIIFCLLGFILARAKIFGKISFLGLAFSAASPIPFYAWAVFGAGFGYLSLFEGIYSIRFICCTLGAAMIKGFSQRFNKNTGVFFIPCVVSLCLISTLLALILSDEKEIQNTFYYILESGFAFIFTYCFINPLDFIVNKNQKFISLDLISAGVTVFVLYVVLCYLPFLSFSIPRITGVMAILLLSYIFKEKGGAIGGAAVGLASFIAYNDISLGAIFSFSGLVSSLFQKFGQAGLAAAFILSVSLLAYFNPTENSVPLVAQSAAACLLFVLLPKGLLEDLRLKLNRQSIDEKIQKRKISNIKNSIFSVGQRVKDVLSELSKIENKDEALIENEKCAELRRALADSFFTSAEILDEILNNDFKEILKSKKPEYKFETGVFSQSGGESKYCGDSVAFSCDDGALNVILSDGMGTGARAAVDSQMTVMLFEDLIKSGIKNSTALKLVNSALIAKSQDETLATLDALNIDSFTGHAEIFKAGAAPSFILKDNEILKVEPITLPVGILRDIKSQSEEFILHSGDRIVMLSDGTLTQDLSWLEEKIKDKSLSAQELCEEIAKTARQNQKDIKKDDLTVAAIDIKMA